MFRSAERIFSSAEYMFSSAEYIFSSAEYKPNTVYGNINTGYYANIYEVFEFSSTAIIPMP